MSNKKKRKPTTRAEPKSAAAWLCSPDAYETLVCQGYTDLAHNPEICTAVDTIARLVGSMTIHLMANTDRGDIRIKNGLSRKVDIEPNRYMSRGALLQWIVRTMLLEGDGNAVLIPSWSAGSEEYLDELTPVPASMVSFPTDGGWGYRVSINGQERGPDEVLHFTLNPDPACPWKGCGYRVALREVANNLKQAAATEKGFLSSKWKPSLIVKVDSMAEELASKAGRKALLEQYIEAGEAGEPWMIPAEQFAVEQVRPLSLSDLALSDIVQLDKRTVASIIGVPPFVLGVGEFRREAWNNFISSRIMPLAQSIEQELTRKLLVSPGMFFRFNPRSLYNYELRDLAAIADDQFVRGIMTGNEVRDWIGLSPMDGLDDLVILENYIPRGMIGEQNKLNQNLNGGDE